MIGKTNSGFTFDVDEQKLDDYKLMKKLNDVSNGQPGKIVEVIGMLLGPDQEEKLMDHVEKLNDGKCSATGMIAELESIFEVLKGKNSSSSPT